MDCGFCGKSFSKKVVWQYYCSRDCKRKSDTRKYLSKNKHNDGFKARKKTAIRKHKDKTKARLLDLYGNSCECCGCSIIEFLTLEHRNKNGSNHRKDLGGSLQTWKEAIEVVNKDKYTILCMNCNWFQRFGKQCPCRKKELTYSHYEDHRDG